MESVTYIISESINVLRNQNEKKIMRLLIFKFFSISFHLATYSRFSDGAELILGVAVGVSVGNGEGKWVVGSILGLKLAQVLGCPLGYTVGTVVEPALGSIEGLSVDDPFSVFVGIVDGDFDGNKLGQDEGYSLGCAVGFDVG